MMASDDSGTVIGPIGIGVAQADSIDAAAIMAAAAHLPFRLTISSFPRIKCAGQLYSATGIRGNRNVSLDGAPLRRLWPFAVVRGVGLMRRPGSASGQRDHALRQSAHLRS